MIPFVTEEEFNKMSYIQQYNICEEVKRHVMEFLKDTDNVKNILFSYGNKK